MSAKQQERQKLSQFYKKICGTFSRDCGFYIKRRAGGNSFNSINSPDPFFRRVLNGGYVRIAYNGLTVDDVLNNDIIIEIVDHEYTVKVISFGESVLNCI